jgi:hypothetical protein
VWGIALSLGGPHWRPAQLRGRLVCIISICAVALSMTSDAVSSPYT